MYVGVILNRRTEDKTGSRIPHVRGGDPVFSTPDRDGR